MLDTGTLPLRAELVVLSACQTGLGDLKQAEGTVGLQRAFLGKGARSVLVSLLSVGDAATEALMKRFYAHWLGDPNAPSKGQKRCEGHRKTSVRCRVSSTDASGRRFNSSALVRESLISQAYRKFRVTGQVFNPDTGNPMYVL